MADESDAESRLGVGGARDHVHAHLVNVCEPVQSRLDARCRRGKQQLSSGVVDHGPFSVLSSHSEGVGSTEISFRNDLDVLHLLDAWHLDADVVEPTDFRRILD